MKNKAVLFLALTSILIIGAWLRIYKITTIPPGLYPDEAMNGNNAIEAIENRNFKVFYPENNGREGLFIDTQALFLKLFNENKPWVIRIPSAIFGILTILGIYFLATRMFSARIGLLSAFLLSVNFWHINFSRIAFRSIMAPLILVWAMYFLIAAFESIYENKKSRAYIYSTLSGLVFSLGFYTYIAYRIMPLLVLFVIFLYFIRYKSRKTEKMALFKSICFFTISAVIAALPIGIYFLKNPSMFFGRTSQISIFNSPNPIKDFSVNILKTAGMFNFYGDQNWRHNYAGKPELYWPVGILFLIGIIEAIRTAVSKKPYNNGDGKRMTSKHSMQIIILWIALASLPVVISNEGVPHALRSILLIPPVIILSAVGGIKVYEYINKKSRRCLSISFAAVFIAALILNVYTTYFNLWAKNKNTYDAFSANYVKLADRIKRMPKNMNKYIIVEAKGVEVNGIPMPAQTIMFLTKSYTKQDRMKNNIYYVLPKDKSKIPIGSILFRLK